MKNLDQIRAKSAIAHKDKITNSQNGGDAISGFPMIVVTGGLLAALAFATEWKDVEIRPEGDQDMRRQVERLDRDGRPRRQWQKRKHEGEYTIARAITKHLRDGAIKITQKNSADEFIAELANENTDLKLRRATTEAIQFLNYLKRFVA